MSLVHRTHRPGAGPVHGRTLRREARTVSTALASLTAASLLSGSVVSFAEQRTERTVHESAPVVTIGLVDVPEGHDGHGRVGSEVVALAVEVGDLAPGAIDEGCVVVAYGVPAGESSAGDGVVSAQSRRAAASLRLTGRVDPVTAPTTTASAFIEVGSGARADCTDFVASSALYAGDLHRLAVEHGNHADGLPLVDSAIPGATATLRLVVSIPPGAEPPPVVAPFWLDVEARPLEH